MKGLKDKITFIATLDIRMARIHTFRWQIILFQTIYRERRVATDR